MNNLASRHPQALSESEWQEISAIPQVQQAWGLDEQDDSDTLGHLLASMAFGVKFDYVSGGPGYVGELFSIYGDSIDQPLTLIRNRTTKELNIA